MPAETQNRDLTLPPDTYLYLQNEGKGGLLSVHRGATVVNQTGQDQPVRYESQTRRFVPCSLEQAVQQFPRAGEGDYVIIDRSKNLPEDSKYVLAVLDNAAMIKKLRINKENQTVMFVSESKSEHPPIVATLEDLDDIYINGEVVQIVKM